MNASATAVDPDVAAAARDRLHAVLTTSDPTDGLWAMVTDGWFDTWIPEICQMQMEQDPIHRHKDVLTHTIAVTASTPPDLRVRLAALLHDIGKPATRRFGPEGVTFRHHEAVGSRIAKRRLAVMGFDEQFVADVARLVELSGRFKGYSNGWTDSAVRRYARDSGPLLGDLNQLVRCDCTTRNNLKRETLHQQVDDLERRIRDLAAADAVARERPPLSGDQIMELLGIGPGPKVGAALKALHAEHRERGPLDDDAARRFVEDWWAAHGD